MARLRSSRIRQRWGFRDIRTRCGTSHLCAGRPKSDDRVMCAAVPLRSPPSPRVLFPVQLSANPRAAKCVARPSRAARRARTVARRRRNPLATRTPQHEPSDKNKRFSNATGRREADAAAAQMRCRERAARNSHEGEEDRKPDILLNPQR